MSDFNEMLISLVQANPLLYNASLANYKNDRIKENIWKEISEELKVDSKFSTCLSSFFLHKQFVLNRCKLQITALKEYSA